MPGVAGAVKVIFQADTNSYSVEVKKAKEQLGVFENSAKSAGATARREMNEARGTVMVLGEEIGVHLPRHVQKFVAGLPGVASAMSAAFSAVAVFAIGAAVVEAARKVYEFTEKVEEAAKKNATAWRDIAQPMQQTNDELRLANDKIESAIAKLEGKPQNGLKQAIDEAIVSADTLGAKLQADIGKIVVVLDTQKVPWYQKLAGNAGTGDIGDHAKGLQENLNEIELEGHNRLNELRKQNATEAQLKAATDDLNGKRKAAIDAELVWAEGALAASQKLQANVGRQNLAGRLDQSARISQLTSYSADLARGSDYAALMQQHVADVAKQLVLQAAKDSPKPVPVDNTYLLGKLRPEFKTTLDWEKLVAGGPPTKATAAGSTLAGFGESEAERAAKEEAAVRQRAAREGFRAAMEEIDANEKMREAWIRVQRETGRIDELGAARQLQDLHGRSYGQYQSAFIAAQSNGANLGPGDTARLNAGYKIQAQQDAFSVEMATPFGQLRDNLERLASEFTSFGDVLSETATRGLETFNETLLKTLSTPGNILRGTHPWRNLGSNLAQEAGGSALRFGEGEAMKLLFGKDPKAKLGTKDNPMWTKSVDAAGAAAGSSSGLLTNLFGSLFGGKGSSSGAASAIGDIAGMALNFLPGFAEGGMIPSNMPVLVGENGPEILAGAGGHRVVPNNEIGGGVPVIHVDARGSGDPAAVEAAVQRGIAGLIPHIPNLAVAGMADRARRLPASRNRV